MKRIVLTLVAAAALASLGNTAMAQGPYYRPGVRVGVYGGFAPYYYPRPYYYGPRYYPPPGYYYPPPVYAPPPVVYGPGISFSFGR